MMLQGTLDHAAALKVGLLWCTGAEAAAACAECNTRERRKRGHRCEKRLHVKPFHFGLSDALVCLSRACLGNLSLKTKKGNVAFRHFSRHSFIRTIILPRQARDKHRENSKKNGFCLRLQVYRDDGGWDQQSLLLRRRRRSCSDVMNALSPTTVPTR